MKKLLIIICLLPFTGFAQTIIKTIEFPKIPLDSITKLRIYRVSAPVEGTKKDKLAAVLGKWFGSNFTATNNATQAADSSLIKINGEGNILGSYAAQQITAFQSKPDKLVVNMPPVDYKIKFIVKVIVMDGKYNIALSNFKIEVFNVVTPLEQYYRGNFPTIIIPDGNEGMDISEMYSHIFNDVNVTLQRVADSASKYIAKAKKKGIV